MYARPLWIIATGESRLLHPVNELKEEGHMVMGINRVIRETPLNLFHTQHGSDYAHDFQRIRGTGVTAIVPADEGRYLGYSMTYSRDMIPHAGSGLTGLYLGAIMGFDPIFLVGYDHHQGGTPKYNTDQYAPFREDFSGIAVYNTAHGSKLEVFPYRSFEDCRHGEV
jgi:hypothetical protein